MTPWPRLLAAVLLAVVASTTWAQGQTPSTDGAVFLVAAPALRDPEYRQTVLIASPTANGGHVGVIINRPTRRSLSSLFPEHEPSKKVVEPVFFGGPFSTTALVAVVRGDASPGQGSLLMMSNLYLAINVNTIDKIIEERPTDARFYVGYVGWRPGELRREIDRGLWHVLNPDVNTIFRKDTDTMWEEMLRMSRQISAPAAAAQPTDRGFFLVAKPSILDPNFQRTVVLVANAPDGATLGVIINRPTQQSLASILPGNPTLARFTEPLYFGGPVERVGLFAVFRAKGAPGESLPAGDDLHLALQPPTVEQLLLKPPEQVRFFNGYSGWAPGQLANELQRGDWWVFDADADTVFRKDTSTLWEELARRARSITAQATTQ